MRIIGGLCKGQRLFSPEGDEVRPTSDKIRESIFNVLTHNEEWVCLEKASVLDLFAGSGAMGLEALSRGALSAIFVDNSQSALDTIEKISPLLLKTGDPELPFNVGAVNDTNSILFL